MRPGKQAPNLTDGMTGSISTGGQRRRKKRRFTWQPMPTEYRMNRSCPSIIDVGVTREFLARERNLSRSETVTPDCRRDLCAVCGACEEKREERREKREEKTTLGVPGLSNQEPDRSNAPTLYRSNAPTLQRSNTPIALTLQLLFGIATVLPTGKARRSNSCGAEADGFAFDVGSAEAVKECYAVIFKKVQTARRAGQQCRGFGRQPAWHGFPAKSGANFPCQRERGLSSTCSTHPV